jgi:hypothetical protein
LNAEAIINAAVNIQYAHPQQAYTRPTPDDSVALFLIISVEDRNIRGVPNGNRMKSI